MCVQRTLAFVSNRKELPEVYRNPVYAHVDDLRRRAQLGPSFAYSLPVHYFHTRRDRVASGPRLPFAWRGHTQSLTTRARPSPDLAVWLE